MNTIKKLFTLICLAALSATTTNCTDRLMHAVITGIDLKPITEPLKKAGKEFIDKHGRRVAVVSALAGAGIAIYYNREKIRNYFQHREVLQRLDREKQQKKAFEQTPEGQWIAAAQDSDQTKLAELLKKNPSLINTKTPKTKYGGGGETAVHFAVDYRNHQRVEWLAQQGADLNIETNAWRYTPLQQLLTNVHKTENTLKVLLAYGADPNKGCKNCQYCFHGGKQTAFTAALRPACAPENHIQAIKYLIAAGADWKTVTDAMRAKDIQDLKAGEEVYPWNENEKLDRLLKSLGSGIKEKYRPDADFLESEEYLQLKAELEGLKKDAHYKKAQLRLSTKSARSAGAAGERKEESKDS